MPVKELNIAREKLIDQTIFSTAIFLFVALIPSMSRYFEMGWQPIFAIHIFISIISIALSVLRKRLPLIFKGHLLFILFVFISISGLFFYKTVGGSYFALVVIAISTMVFGLRTGAVYTAVFLLAFAIIGSLHVGGIIKNSLDFDKYINQITTWITLITGYAFAAIVLVNSVYLFYRFYIDSIVKINEKSQEITTMYEALKISEQRYRLIFEGSNDGFFFVDDQFKVIDCNVSFVKLTGYELSELKGIDYKLLINNNEHNWDTYLYKVALSKNNKTEIVIVNKDGDLIPVEASIYSISHNDAKYFWAIVRDLRKEKALEKEIYDTMIYAEESERERYAKELHDGLGPLLSTGLIYVYTIAEESADKQIKEYAKRASDILLEATDTVKEISNNLSPIILREYGIAQATRSFIEKIRQATHIKFLITEDSPRRFNETVEFTVYRTLVELINNTMKYSGAKSVNIKFGYEQPYYCIAYQDDGCGFDYNTAVKANKGFGLLNLKNRIMKINGYYSYITTPGKGVLVTIRLNPKKYD